MTMNAPGLLPARCCSAAVPAALQAGETPALLGSLGRGAVTLAVKQVPHCVRDDDSEGKELAVMGPSTLPLLPPPASLPATGWRAREIPQQCPGSLAHRGW